MNTTTQAHAAKLSWLDKVNWTRDAAGQELVPVIAQDQVTGKVLMFAFMNREALRLTVETGHAVYWSRSRNTLWHKGEESGHVQHVHELRLDCDEDVILMTVEQVGGIACHTGRHDCFFQKLENGVWIIDQPVLKNPAEIYRHE